MGIAPRTHVAVHACSSEGTVLVDLYAPRPLLEKLSTVEKLLSAGASDGDDPPAPPAPAAPAVRWSHKLRGFQEGFGGYKAHQNPPDNDLGWDVLIRSHKKRPSSRTRPTSSAWTSSR